MSAKWMRVPEPLGTTVAYLRRVGSFRLVVMPRDSGVGWRWLIMAKVPQQPDSGPLLAGWRPTSTAAKQEVVKEVQKLLAKALLDARPDLEHSMPKLVLLCGRRGGLSHLRKRM